MLGSEVDCFSFFIPQEKNFKSSWLDDARKLNTWGGGGGLNQPPIYVPAQFSTYDPNFVHADEQKLIKRPSMVNMENFNLLQRVQDH